MWTYQETNGEPLPVIVISTLFIRQCLKTSSGHRYDIPSLIHLAAEVAAVLALACDLLVPLEQRTECVGAARQEERHYYCR